MWPVGYFLRAKLHFARRLEAERPGILKETVTFIKTTLTKHYEMIMTSDWRSLPELTDANGEVLSLICLGFQDRVNFYLSALLLVVFIKSCKTC